MHGSFVDHRLVGVGCYKLLPKWRYVGVCFVFDEGCGGRGGGGTDNQELSYV